MAADSGGLWKEEYNTNKRGINGTHKQKEKDKRR
jgi:hypothetical protein